MKMYAMGPDFLYFLLSEDQAQELAATVSVDKEKYSVSFNEFLQFMYNQKTTEPDEETLVKMFA